MLSRDFIIKQLRNKHVATVISWILAVSFFIGAFSMVYGTKYQKEEFINFGIFLLKISGISFIINSLSSYIVGILSFEEFKEFTKSELTNVKYELKKDIRQIRNEFQKDVQDIHEEEIFEGRNYLIKHVILDFIIRPSDCTDIKKPWEVIMIENRRGIRFSKKVVSYSSDNFVLDVPAGDLEKCTFPVGVIRCDGKSIIVENNKEATNQIITRTLGGFLVGTFLIRPQIHLNDKNNIENIVIIRHFPENSNAWPNTDKKGKSFAKFAYTVLTPIEHSIFVNVYVEGDDKCKSYFESLLKRMQQNEGKSSLKDLIYVTEFEGIRTKRYAIAPAFGDPDNQKYYDIIPPEVLEKLNLEKLEPLVSFKVYPRIDGTADPFRRLYIGYRVNLELKNL